MKAVLLTPERTLELADRAVPDEDPDAVLLQVELCGICGTDLHAAELGDLFAPPVVLGHEFTARVVAVGARVASCRVGDRVVVNPIALVCGACGPCLAGLPNQCIQALSSDCVGVGRDGGMAEYVSLDPAYLRPLPEDLPAAVGAWTEPLAVAVRGVHRGNLRAKDRITILGAGPIGQLTLQTALAYGARNIMVVESSSHRRNIALTCGASGASAPGDVDDVRGEYDVVFDCAGAPTTLDAAIRVVSSHGRVVVIGTNAGHTPLRERMSAHLKEVNITFSICYASVEFDAAIELLRDGRVDVGPLTTRIAAIDDYAAAFAEMRNPEASVKVLVAPVGMS